MPETPMKLGRAAIAATATLACLVTACQSTQRGENEPAGVPPRAELAITVPDSFLIAFETSKGRFDVMARTSWAPVGVDRLYDLVRRGYYDDVFFFRVVPNFVAQFGITGDSAINAAWRMRRIADDSTRHTNARGTLSFARSGAGTRTVQLFINLRDNARLDTLNGFGFPPIAQVVSGMSVVDSLYNGYGDSAPAGGRGGGAGGTAAASSTRRGPQQNLVSSQGNAYLRRDFPLLDYIKTARIVQEWRRNVPPPRRP
jgi:peptidyl-prolyl cis-trans isomerase A (cyclophilin A)